MDEVRKNVIAIEFLNSSPQKLKNLADEANEEIKAGNIVQVFNDNEVAVGYATNVQAKDNTLVIKFILI